MHGCVLNGLNLQDRDLHLHNLTSCSLIDVVVTNTKLPHDLHRCNWTGVVLQNRDLRQFSVHNSIFTNCSLVNTLLPQDLHGCDLSGVSLEGRDLTSYNFSNSNLSNANFSNANLTNAAVTNANFSNATLTNVIAPQSHPQSSILSISDVVRIAQWLNNNNNNVALSQLLYRGSRDGFSAQAFHSHCDNHSPTLVVVRSSNGNKFGGFTEATWANSIHNSYGQSVADPSNRSFVFSLTNNMKFPLIPAKNAQALYCSYSYGPVFCGSIAFSIGDQCNTGNNSSSYFDGTIYAIPNGANINGQTVLAGSQSFTVSEIEVFQL